MGFPNKTMFFVNLSWCLSLSNFGIELAGCPTTDVLQLAACLHSMPMLLAVSFVVAVQFPALRSGTLENGQMLAMSIFFVKSSANLSFSSCFRSSPTSTLCLAFCMKASNCSFLCTILSQNKCNYVLLPPTCRVSLHKVTSPQAACLQPSL